MSGGRWIALAAACATLLARSASAFSFVLLGGGSDQTLTLRWDTNTQHCISCGTSTSANARIPLGEQAFVGGRVGGSLDWSTSSGRLTLVAMPIAWAFGSSIATLVDAWSSVDARTPPTFLLIGETGDPPSVDLLIRPRIVGTLERVPNAGGLVQTWLRFSQAVIVNGVTATSDSLERDEANSGTSAVGPVSFSKGTLGNVVLHGVPLGSTFTIPVWAYMRAIAQGPGTVDAYSSYGNGLAVEIDIRNANAVGVDDLLPPSLAFSARPNPASGRARFECRLPAASRVRLTLHDVAGHEVTTLIDGWEPAGAREATWNGSDASGNPVASGIYLAQLVVGAERRSHKLVWMGR